MINWKKILAGGAVVVLLVIIGASYRFAYQYGRSVERELLAQMVAEQTEQAMKEAQKSVDAAVERERAAVELLNVFKSGRTDEASIDWAGQPIPSGELERLHDALCDISTCP